MNELGISSIGSQQSKTIKNGKKEGTEIFTSTIRISQSSSTQLLTKTFRQAYSERKPETGLMFHSDRGTQYISYTFVRLLETLSLSRTGRPHDNAVSEAFFSILKKEELYRRRYKSEIDMIQGIHHFIDFYNNERPHSTLQYKTPVQKEQEYWDKKKESSLE